MAYEKELDLLIERAKKERHEMFDKISRLEPCSTEAGRLNHELQLLCRRHDKELADLRKKYHLSPPKVIDNSKEPI